MMQRVSKITLLSNDKTNGDVNTVCNYTFNQMTQEEQDKYLGLSISVSVGSHTGGVGYSMMKKLQGLTSEMEAKYNPTKPETLFEMKRRLLKQGLK